MRRTDRPQVILATNHKHRLSAGELLSSFRLNALFVLQLLRGGEGMALNHHTNNRSALGLGMAEKAAYPRHRHIKGLVLAQTRKGPAARGAPGR